ncbi:MAG: DUF2397 family protein [Bacillota bacterium]
MTHTLLKPIVELSYLISAQNVARYRCIMRYFYEQHQRLRYWLRPEDVYEGVGRYELLDNYTFEQCQKEVLPAAGKGSGEKGSCELSKRILQTSFSSPNVQCGGFYLLSAFHAIGWRKSPPGDEPIEK